MDHFKVGTLVLANLLLGSLILSWRNILLNELLVLLQLTRLHIDVSLELLLVGLILLFSGRCDISVAILLNLVR